MRLMLLVTRHHQHVFRSVWRLPSILKRLKRIFFGSFGTIVVGARIIRIFAQIFLLYEYCTLYYRKVLIYIHIYSLV